MRMSHLFCSKNVEFSRALQGRYTAWTFNKKYKKEKTLLTNAPAVNHFESLETGANPRHVVILHKARLLAIMFLSA